MDEPGSWFFKHFTSKNQLHGFYISETLLENGLIKPERMLLFSASLNMSVEGF